MEENINPIVFEVLDKNLCMYAVMTISDYKEANELLLKKAINKVKTDIETTEHMIKFGGVKNYYNVVLNYDKEMLERLEVLL